MIKNILVVCIGNICRSPTAEALLKRKLPQVNVRSAGLMAMIGYPADETAQSVAADYQLDLDNHRAEQITELMCKQADLILVMESRHREVLEKTYPFVRGKTFRLGNHNDRDVPDPYLNDRTVFESIYSLIAEGVERWATDIAKLA